MSGGEVSIEHINWQRLCNNLRARYKALSTVARELNTDAQHIRRLARGEVKWPRFITGHKLLDLHLDVCPDLHNWRVLGYENA